MVATLKCILSFFLVIGIYIYFCVNSSTWHYYSISIRVVVLLYECDDMMNE